MNSARTRPELIVAVLSAAVLGNLNSNGQQGVVRTLSAKTMGQSKMNVGAGVNYAQSSDYLRWVGPPYPKELDSTKVETAKLLSSNIFLSLGLSSFWDMAAAMPFYWDGTDHYFSDFGLGDLEVSTKLLYPALGKPRVFYQAYWLAVDAGLSQMSNKGIYPRHAYYYADEGGGDIFTADGFVVKGMLLWTFDIGAAAPSCQLKIHANLGGAVPNDRKAISALANFAAEYSPADVVTLFVDCASEIRGKTIIDDPAGFRKDLIWITPGLRITSPAGVYVSVAGDFGLSDQSKRTLWTRDTLTYTTAPVPKWGIVFSVGWSGFLSAQDDDKDGIKNSDDRCPNDPEDIDGFEDADGCPDPDNDHDGLCDPWVSEKGQLAKYASVCKGIDKCPNEPEDKDGFQDDDGCPDPDNDRDGIPDIKDQCPNQPEDFDGFEDKDGCPDYDNDKDGIPDSLDKCPNDPEDFDKFQDDDGCPDLDNDHDGIPDLKDKCPNEPEDFDNYQDDDGCPEGGKPVPQIQSSLPKEQILRGVNFKTGKAELTPGSYAVLDPVVEELKKFPETELEIRGHTDGLGSPVANMQLSQLRAEAVRQYLVLKNIDPRRLRAMGFGASNPIADNRTAAGREQNRRIEIIRIK